MDKEEAAEKKQHQDEILLQARHDRAVKDAYRKVFLGSKEGKLVLQDILESTGVLRDTEILGDRQQSDRAAGARKFGLAVLDMLDKRGFEAITHMEEIGLELTKLGEEFEL